MLNQDDLFNCVGWQATNRIGLLTEMFHVFKTNYDELQALFAKIHNDIQVSKETYKEAWNHLPQRIFNYLSASAALIEQTRRMMQFYVGQAIYTEYKQKIFDVFESNKCAKFVKKLRNYQTHFQIEYPYPVRSLDDNKSWDIVLISDELLKHPDEWDKPSKEFIQACGNEINLNKVFAEYTKLVYSLYTWLFDQLVRCHEKDFVEKKYLEKQLNMNSDDLKNKLAQILS